MMIRDYLDVCDVMLHKYYIMIIESSFDEKNILLLLEYFTT